MDFDPSEIRWRRLDGNHGYCATRCIECCSTREIYVRDPDEMHRCECCGAEWLPEAAQAPRLRAAASPREPK